MSTAARKARKAAGIQFTHPVKVGTPITQRSRFEYMAPTRALDQMILRGFDANTIAQTIQNLKNARTARAAERRARGRVSRYGH